MAKPSEREKQQKKNGKELKAYEERLRKTSKVYVQKFEADAINQRKSRAAAIGACVLQAMDELQGLWKTKPLRAGSLEWNFAEQKIVDPDGKKGFHETVQYSVASGEPAYSEDEIRELIEDTRKRMELDLNEMYPEEAAEDGTDSAVVREGEV